MTSDKFRTTILCRPRLRIPAASTIDVSKYVLITGVNGSIGTALGDHLVYNVMTRYIGVDKVTDPLDITNEPLDITTEQFPDYFHKFHKQISAVIHLAAHKYATVAEMLPAEVADVNIRGTQNVIDAAAKYNIPVVTASTCKAADPCTVYGASKLIAERITTNYKRGSVVRLVNVIGSTGSVIPIWAKENSAGKSLPVCHAERMFICVDEAIDLLLFALGKPGIYGPKVPLSTLYQIGFRAFPNAKRHYVSLRRGDRKVERIVGEYEASRRLTGSDVLQIFQPWTGQ